jgi:hypothetical protein
VIHDPGVGRGRLMSNKVLVIGVMVLSSPRQTSIA